MSRRVASRALSLVWSELEQATRVEDIVESPTVHNYGWLIVAYGKRYDGGLINGGRSQFPGTDQPAYYWDPAIAPAGMTFYTGKLLPEWQNNLFAAALGGHHLARLMMVDGKVLGEERLLLANDQRVRDVKQGPEGALWVVTDDDDGRLIRIAPKARVGTTGASFDETDHVITDDDCDARRWIRQR